MLRYIGDVDRPKLIAFLERHVTVMPRTMLRYAIEKMAPDERTRWLSSGSKARVSKPLSRR